MREKGVSEKPLFTVLNPVAEEPAREIHPLSPRPDTLEGKTVNVINLHGGNEEVVESIAPDLKGAVPGCNVVYLRTEGGHGAGPLTDDDWDGMLDCDAAILGHNY